MHMSIGMMTRHLGKLRSSEVFMANHGKCYNTVISTKVIFAYVGKILHEDVELSYKIHFG